ncbi:MAG: prolyl oligopeptidase family serine peptidase [Candidatus Zixiibacteriota bacterium]
MIVSILRIRTVALVTMVALGLFMVAKNGRSQTGKPAYPATPKHPVTSEYFGTKVTEDYRWLENQNDPEVMAWVAEQNELTFSLINADPAHERIKSYVKQLYSAESSTYYSLAKVGGVLFAMKDQPPREQPFLVTLASPDDTVGARVVVDPNQIDSTGSTTIDFYVPSHDARLVAVSMSKGGSEDGSAYIFDVASGRQLADVIPRVSYPTGGGSVSWAADNSGISYTRYPAEGEKKPDDMHFYQQVYYHKLGTPVAEDRYAIGKEFPRIAEVALQTSEDGKYTLATVSNGDGGEYAHFIQGPSGNWTQITQFQDRVSTAKFGLNQSLYLLSRKDAPNGKILQMPLTATELSKTKVVVPTGSASINDFTATSSRLYVEDMVGGPTQLRIFDLNGQELKSVETEPVSTVRALTWIGGDDILYQQESYLHPAAWYHYSPIHAEPRQTAMVRKSRVNFDDAEVVREMVTSKDGAKIPINIIRKKGTRLDGSNPVILYGYGGYGVNMSPGFSTWRRVWLDQGGVYVIANLRGGGEFGDAWHQAGNLTRKQNVFDDYAACAQYLIDKGYTTPQKLVAMGGSNGGLLMGAALTQHPELFRVVISYVGIYDMLRVELSPNGEFNTTEFGTVKDKAQFDALYAYSPYHHVVDGKAYPAVLFLTGENDGRVDPANSRKMTARLQAASGSDQPILLRQSSTSGHGIGTSFSDQIEEDGDVFSFLFGQLGIVFYEGQ